MTIKRIMAVAISAMALSACTPNDVGLGDAAKANYAAHIVDPDPVYADAMAANGAQTAAAQDRYRKGAVKKPKSIRTTGGGSGSGSSTGSN
jgi:hypothetical protein